MRKLPGVVLGLLLVFSPAGARQDQTVCGTHRERLQEALYLHRQAQRLRLKLVLETTAARQAAPSAAARDAGQIAILEDSDGVVGRLNSFNLNRRTVSFQPTAAGASRYRFQTGDDSYDAAAASAGSVIQGIGDDDAREYELPFSFPFFGASYQKVFINSDGNLTLTASDTASSDRSLGRMTSGPPRIAGLFRDLDPTRSQRGIQVLSEPSRFVVSWVSVPEYQDYGFGLPQTFQVRLYPDGQIQLAYSDISTQSAIVGISPGNLTGAAAVVSFAGGTSDEFSGTVAERFSETTEVDIVSTAQKFYETHDDAYDYLVIFNNMGIAAATGAVAYEVTVRNDRTGYGDVPAASGGEFGSPSRLQAVLNMGPLDQYPSNPGAIVPARSTSGDTPLTILGHEAGHLFLAFASVRDPGDPAARPMLGRQLAHWSFLFNSEASLLEGNRIRDDGPNASPRFTTVATVEGYAPLDQYLMGLRAAEEVSPMFLVTHSDIPNGSRAPQVGVSFDGDRRDIRVEEIIAAEGRRTPDYTVAQRRFRFGFILIVPQGTQPPADALAKLEAFRGGFESFYARASSQRATADATLRRSLKLSVFPAAGVLQGQSATATLTLARALDASLTVALKTETGSAETPASVTIPARASSATFSIRGVRAGVEELSAEPADSAYETAFARVQVLAPGAGLRLAVVSGDEQIATPGKPLPDAIVIRASDVNNLPYPGLRIQASVSAGGSVDPPVAVTDEKGRASFRWTAGAGPLNELQAGVAGTSGFVTATALGKPVVSEGGVVNAASYKPGISPGSLATIFGANLAGGDVTRALVILSGRPVSPFFASERQINFLAPRDLPEGTADLSVSTPQGVSAAVQVAVQAISPGIFYDTGSGYGAVLFTGDGRTLEVFGTGFGPLHADASGLLETAPVQALVSGKPATVIFSGQAPGFPGLYQVDVRVPDGVAGGVQTLSLRLDSQSSNEVKIQVK